MTNEFVEILKSLKQLQATQRLNLNNLVVELNTRNKEIPPYFDQQQYLQKLQGIFSLIADTIENEEL